MNSIPISKMLRLGAVAVAVVCGIETTRVSRALAEGSSNAAVRMAQVVASAASRSPGGAESTRAPASAASAGAVVEAPPADSEGAAGANGVPASVSETKPPSPAVQAILDRTAAIRALLGGALDVGVEPQSLFAVSLGDERGIRVEVERLRAVVAAVDHGSLGLSGTARLGDGGVERSEPGASVDRSAGPRSGVVRHPAASSNARKQAAGRGVPPPTDADAGVDASSEANEGDAGAAVVDFTPLDPELWSAQIELDRAHLAFLERSPEQRRAILDAHATRQRESAEMAKKRTLTAAERSVREAALEREEAIAAARAARGEAERLVAEERVRLLGVIKQQAEFEADIARQELELHAAEEVTLRLLREAREMREDKWTASGAGGAADALYIRLRKRLREARNELAVATSRLAGARRAVPSPGENRLVALPVEVDVTAVSALRTRAQLAVPRITDAERRYVAKRAAQLCQEVESLNAERLSLLPLLSASERQAIQGFGSAGLDQAVAEVRQVVVVLRYHLVKTLSWARALTDTGSARGRTALEAILLTLRAIPALVFFVWWRRRAERTLLDLGASLNKNAGRGAALVTGDSAASRALALVMRIRRPAEWLLLVFAVTWALPSSITGLLEYALAYTVLVWTLGGTLAVLVIDHWASDRRTPKRRSARVNTARLRLRSLKLVGRVVVALGLLLALTVQVVGAGTIYGWVLRSCWFAAVPVGLLLVLWWRSAIFSRIDAKRKQTGVEHWVIAHRSGWQSFAAATLGGTTLVLDGIHRRLRVWLGSFTLSRRVLAYLFRREINKKADSGPQGQLEPLDDHEYVALGPATPSEVLVPSVADDQVAEVMARVVAPGGGVFAIVGERGLGKSTVLRRIAAESPGARLVECPFGGMEAFAPAFLAMLDAEQHAVLEPVVEAFEASARPDAAILIDDAHRLIHPMMGGLRAFDRVLEIARRNSKNVAWVFAFDEVIWRFFERIRGAQPLFDDVVRLRPWGEEGIGRLLAARSDTVGIKPSFERVVSVLPNDADESDVQEAHERAEANYYRLIWDYAGGNPGVALYVWRNLLGLNEAGRHTVRVFQAPSSESLERLPDSAVFVLRAVIQLERAEARAISSATGVSLAEVEDALRFGVVRGYFQREAHGYGLSWEWFRVITRFLQRRHLLFAE